MKILVVDDSAAMRMIVMRTIRMAGFTGHTFVEAGNGLEGLDMVETARPDLILLDWNMPKMTGLEMLTKLKEQGKDIPAGFVTSEGTPEMRQRASDAGALFLINKPFTVESFQMALEMVMP